MCIATYNSKTIRFKYISAANRHRCLTDYQGNRVLIDFANNTVRYEIYSYQCQHNNQ